MSNQEILEKAIRLAIDGGWKYQGKALEVYENGSVFLMDALDGDGKLLVEEPDYWNIIIFNHDFAKSLWGDRNIELGEVETSDGSFHLTVPAPAWKYHLQQMVISEDPIKYLGEHLGRGEID